MPLESSESSDSSDIDEFDLKRLLRSRHLRRSTSTDPSTRARSGSRREREGDGDVVASSDSSMAQTRSDWTRRRRSRRSTRGGLRDGGMSQTLTNPIVDEYDEKNCRDLLPSNRGPYHALQLAAERLTGEMQEDIAQQLESVEVQLEAVGLQMQEAIAAGLKDGTFKSRLRSSNGGEPSGRRSIPACNPTPQPPVDGRKSSASNSYVRDRSSQTSPSIMRHSSHASTDPPPKDDVEYTTEAQLPVKRKSRSEGERKLFRQSGCPLGACECEDTSEDGISEPSVQQYVPDSSGYEYQILKLEGVAPDPDRKGSTSRTKSVVSRDSTSTPSDQSQKSESRVYHARGCQTCRCHTCRVPSDPVQTVQILGVVGSAHGESLATGSREFVTMDVKNGRISGNLGLIEICRDYDAQEGEYDQTWKPASVLQQFNIERSDGEIGRSLNRHEEGVVDRPLKQSEPEGNSKGDLQEESESSKESSEGPYSGDWPKDILKSKNIHQRPSHLKGRESREVVLLDAEAEYPAGQSSPAKNHPHREVHDNNQYRYEGDERLSGVESYVPSHGASSSGRANDLTQNVKTEIFSVIDKEFEYSANDSTSSQSTPDLNENPSTNDHGSRQRASLEAKGVGGKGRTSQEYGSSPRRERNSSDRLESRFVLEEQTHSSPPTQETQAHGFKIPELESVKFEEAHLLSGPRQSQSKERRRSKSHLNSNYQPELRTRSWSHQKRQSVQLDGTTQDEDDGSFTAEERSTSVRAHDNPLFVEANEEVEINTRPRSGTKGPLMASSSSYQFIPSWERVSSSRLAAGEASAGAGHRRTPEKPSLDFPTMEPRPDNSQTWSSDKSTEMKADEAPNRNVAQSRVYIDIRQEYEPGDHPSHQEMQSRMQEEIVREFALLGIQSSPPQTRMSTKDKGESEGPRPNHRSHKTNSVRPDISKFEEDLSRLDNVYRQDSDLEPLAGQMFSSAQDQVSAALQEHSGGDARGSALARILDDGRVTGESRSSVSQKSKRKSKNVRIGEQSGIIERPRSEMEDFAEPQAAAYTDVAHRRPTPYPRELSSDARLRKVELLRQLQNTENLGDSPAQRAQESKHDNDESRSGKCPQALDQRDLAARGGEIPVPKASGSGSNTGRIVAKGADAIVQILNKKSSRFGGRSRSRETSVQHIVSNIPRGSSLFMPPISELLGSTSRQNSIAQIELNVNKIPGLREIESLNSSIPTRSRRLGTQVNLHGQFRDSQTRGSQPTHAMPQDREDFNPGRHPTMIDQNWNIDGDSEDHGDGNSEMQTKRNLQNLNSKSSQKYLAKMLTRLSQKLEVLESKGLIDSQTPQRQGSVDSGLQQQKYDHLSMRKSQDYSNAHFSIRKSQDYSNDHLSMRKSQDYSDDHLSMRKSRDFSNQFRRGTKWPMYLDQDFHHQTQDRGDEKFIGARKIPPMADAWTSRNHQHFRESILANNLQLLSEEMESRRNQNSEKQELQEEWHPRTPHRLSLTEHTEGTEAKSRDHHEENQRGSQTPMPHTFNDTPSRSSLHHQTQMTDNWEARNRQSIQTQTVILDGKIGQDEMQPTDGHIKVTSRQSASSEALGRPQDSSNSEEPPWDRSLETWNPRASRGGPLNPQSKESDLKEAIELAQAQRRNSTSVQTEEFGVRGRPSFQPQFPEHSQDQRMDSMVTQSGDLEFRGSQHLQNQFQRSDPFFLSGEQISQFMGAGRNQHVHSQGQRMSCMPLQTEATEFRDRLYSHSQVPQQSDLQDLERRSRQLSQIQRINSTMQVQNEIMGGMGVMNLGSQQHSQTERMHSFAVQPESRKSGYELVDARSRHRSQAERMYSFAVQPDGMNSMVSNPMFSQRGLPQESDAMDIRNRQHSQTGRMYSLAVQPETMESGMRHHSQSGRMYSHGMQPEGMDPGFHHHSQSGRSYSHAVQPEGMDFGNRLPSQSGGMYGTSIQREGIESGNRHHSQIGGMSGFPEQSETIESQIRHTSQRGRMSNFPVQPEGMEFENRHHSQIGGMSGFPEQSETIESQIRHPSQRGRMSNFPVQPEGMDFENRHHSQIGGMSGFPEQSETIESQIRHPSQRGRMSNFPVQPEGMEFENRHHSQIGVMSGLPEQSETIESQIRHPSQRGRMSNFPVQPEGMDFENRHHSQVGGMYGLPEQSESIESQSRHSSQRGRMSNLPVQPEGMEFGNRQHSQIGGIYGFPEQSETMQSQSRHPSQTVRMSNLPVQPEGVDTGFRHHSQSKIMYSHAVQAEGMDSGFRHPSQSGRIASLAVQPEGMDPEGRHFSIGGGMYGHAEQPDVIMMDPMSRHPSQGGRMSNFPVHPVDLGSEGRHQSQIERMHSFAGQPDAMDFASRHPSQIDRMQSFSMQPGAMDSASRHPSQIDGMQSFAVQPGALDSASRHPSHVERIHSFLVQPEDTDSQRERMYSFGMQPESAEPVTGRHSWNARILGSEVQPETMDSGIRKTSQNRVPEFRTSHHSLVRMPENSSEDFEALKTERKTSSGRDPVNDLPPEVLSLGSKNPRKSSRIQMLNDMLQDLEATVSKSRQNSQARMKSHMLVHELDAVAPRGSKRLSKKLTIQAPKAEQPNLEEIVDQNFEPRRSEKSSKKLTIQPPQEEQPKLEKPVDENFERIGGKKLNHSEVEKSESLPEQFEGEQPETNPDQFGGENLQPFEDELSEPRPEQSDDENLQPIEDEQSGLYSEHFDGENLDNVEGELSGSYHDNPEIIPEESPAGEQQDLLSDQDGSLNPVNGSDRHDSLASHRSDESEYSSGNSSDGTRTSSAYNSQQTSHLAGSQSHSQAQMKDKAHQPEGADPELLQSSDLMPEELETAGTSDSAYLAEGEGEELTSIESEGTGEELTAFETQGEEHTSLKTQGDYDPQEPPAEAPQIDERRVTSRGLDDKSEDLKGKGKGKNLDSTVKDLISGGSSSRRKSVSAPPPSRLHRKNYSQVKPGNTSRNSTLYREPTEVEGFQLH